MLSAASLAGGCFGSGPNGSGAGGSSATQPGRRASDLQRRYPLDSLATATVTIDNQVLSVWLAQEFDEKRPGVVQEGLMHVPSSEIADGQGMLFVFSDEQVRGFWMRNTIAPLDIAFARMDGTIVKIWQMPPLTFQTFSSIEPAMFALEVKQGTFQRLGIAESDRILIPADVFKTSP
jgi:uncharacterized membrane protein (UPF0127 family)